MTSEFIPVALANADNFYAPNPPKEYTLPPPKTEKYTRTYLNYDYGAHDPERPGVPRRSRLSDPLFELKKAVANVKKKVKDNRVEWKLNLRLRDPDDMRGCVQLDLAVRRTVYKYKGEYKQFNFTIENPGDLRTVFFYKRDKAGNIIEGTDPTMSFKMEMEKTAFKKMNFEFGPDGQVVMDPTTGLPKYTEELIDYKTLENKSFDCGLVFCLRDLYHSNGMPIPSLYVRTCWVLSPPTERGAVDSKQSSVLKDFLQGATSEQLNTLMSVIGQLNSGQGSSLLESLKGGAPSQGLLALPAPGQSASSSSAPPQGQQKAMPIVGYPQLPPAGQSAPLAGQPAPSAGHFAPPAGQPAPQSKTQNPAPQIDLTAYMNPGQSMPQAYQQAAQGYPQMPPGYSPEAFNQYLQSGAGGQPQTSVTRI